MPYVIIVMMFGWEMQEVMHIPKNIDSIQPGTENFGISGKLNFKIAIIE